MFPKCTRNHRHTQKTPQSVQTASTECTHINKTSTHTHREPSPRKIFRNRDWWEDGTDCGDHTQGLAKQGYSSAACLHVIIPSPPPPPLHPFHLPTLLPFWSILIPAIFLLLALSVNIQQAPSNIPWEVCNFLWEPWLSCFPFLPVVKFCMNLLRAFSSSFSVLRALGLAVVSDTYCSLGYVSGCLMYYFLCL